MPSSWAALTSLQFDLAGNALSSEQYAALEDLYHSTHGDGWNNKHNWLNGDLTFQGWHGVITSCSAGVASCEVTELWLIENNLVGRSTFFNSHKNIFFFVGF